MCIIYESDRGCYVVFYSHERDEYYMVVYPDQQVLDDMVEQRRGILVGEKELFEVFGGLSMEEISKKLRGNQYLLYDFLNVSIW